MPPPPADLTPTPTRFIRIGEEVGLFQDLLKANPFDEQFRKAAEQNKAASVTLPLVRGSRGGGGEARGWGITQDWG